MRLRTFIISAIGVITIATKAVAFEYPKDAVIFISLGVGDGGGSGTYDLRIAADGIVSTEPLHRPEP
jgi:hypothetical protein